MAYYYKEAITYLSVRNKEASPDFFTYIKAVTVVVATAGQLWLEPEIPGPTIPAAIPSDKPDPHKSD